MRWIFLLLALWGAIHPMYYFLSWFVANGFDLMAMVDAWHVNAASALDPCGNRPDAALARSARHPCDLFDRRELRVAALPVSAQRGTGPRTDLTVPQPIDLVFGFA